MSLEKQLNTLLKTGYAPEDQNFNTALPPPPPPPSTSPPRTPKVTPEGTKQKHGQRLTEEERQIMKELRNQLSGHRKLLQQQLGSISKLRTEKERELVNLNYCRMQEREEAISILCRRVFATNQRDR